MLKKSELKKLKDNTANLCSYIGDYIGLGVCTFTIEELMHVTRTPSDIFSNAADFDKSVLKPMCDEINKNTGLQVTFKRHGIKKPVYAFYISEEKGEEEDTKDISKEEMEEIVSLWNEIAGESERLSEIQRIPPNSTRYKYLNARYKEYGYETVKSAVESVRNSKFLRGEGKIGQNWVVTFEWIFRPNNFVKVIEGRYTDKDYTNGYDRREQEINDMESPF